MTRFPKADASKAWTSRSGALASGSGEERNLSSTKSRNGEE